MIISNNDKIKLGNSMHKYIYKKNEGFFNKFDIKHEYKDIKSEDVDILKIKTDKSKSSIVYETRLYSNVYFKTKTNKEIVLSVVEKIVGESIIQINKSELLVEVSNIYNDSCKVKLNNYDKIIKFNDYFQYLISIYNDGIDGEDVDNSYDILNKRMLNLRQHFSFVNEFIFEYKKTMPLNSMNKLISYLESNTENTSDYKSITNLMYVPQYKINNKFNKESLYLMKTDSKNKETYIVISTKYNLNIKQFDDIKIYMKMQTGLNLVIKLSLKDDEYFIEKVYSRKLGDNMRKYLDMYGN